MILWLLAGCTDAPTNDLETCAVDEPSQTWLVRSIGFVVREQGVVPGFDLDETDEDCGWDDLVSPTGETGIDNGFSALAGALANTAAVGAGSLVDDSIARGELLMTFTLDGVDSWRSDECVNFTFGRAEGVPLVGADGRVLADQTITPSTEIASLYTQGVAHDFDIEVYGLDYRLPFDVLNVALDLEVTQGAFRVQKRFDGALTGEMGGVIPISQITDMLEDPTVRLDAFVPLVTQLADIRRSNGACDGLSFAFTFEAVPVYVR